MTNSLIKHAYVMKLPSNPVNDGIRSAFTLASTSICLEGGAPQCTGGRSSVLGTLSDVARSTSPSGCSDTSFVIN